MERANQDVQHILATLMETKKTTKWSEELKYVQMMKNRSYHEGIKQSPYEALFGSQMKLGLKTSNLPDEAINNLQYEEELEDIINEATLNAVDEAISLSHSEEIIADFEELNDDNLGEVIDCLVTENGELREINLETEEENNNLNSLKVNSIFKLQ